MKKPNFEKFCGSFRSRSFRVGGYSVITTVIVVAIAVVINMMTAALPAEWTHLDITSNELFTISEQTEKLVGELDVDVKIYWIVQSGNEDEYIRALLDRYESMSTHLDVVKKDPNVYPTFVQQYVSDGVSENSLIVECGGRYRYVDYYEIYEYDYTNYYYTGTYDISFAGESSLTSAIDYVVREELPKVYLLTGHGESTLSTAFSTAVEKENIETEELSLLTVDAVPEDADCVMIYAPRSDISADELELLRAYTGNGGCLYLITDPYDGTVMPNLEALMADYGVAPVEGLVVEGNQNYYAWSTPYYLLPDYGSHGITTALESGGYYVLLSIAHGIGIIDETNENLTITELLTTSDDAFSKTAGYNLNTYEKESGDIDGPFALAVAIEDANTESLAVWIGSGSIADDETNSQVSGGNQDLFLNALSWMCEPEENDLSIHAKALTTEYLTIDSGTAASLTVLTVVFIPAIFLGIGIIIFVGRKRK